MSCQPYSARPTAIPMEELRLQIYHLTARHIFDVDPKEAMEIRAALTVLCKANLCELLDDYEYRIWFVVEQEAEKFAISKWSLTRMIPEAYQQYKEALKDCKPNETTLALLKLSVKILD